MNRQGKLPCRGRMHMEVLVQNLCGITAAQVIMWCIGGVLIYLAIGKKMEPALLLPMGFGAILVNLPNSGAPEVLARLYEIGIADNELFPLLLFLGIGAMIDFTPLLREPSLMLFGAAAQFGIFFTLGLASLLGFDLKDAASIAIIGGSGRPTSIFVAQTLNSRYTAAILVARIRTWRWCPLCSRPLSGYAPPGRSGESGCRIRAGLSPSDPDSVPRCGHCDCGSGGARGRGTHRFSDVR